VIYHIVGKFVGIKFGKFTRFKHLAEKVWRMNRLSQKVIIVSRNLDDFSLANYGQFAKFTKLSPCQTFPLYGMVCSYQLLGNASLKHGCYTIGF